jgi:hypothetical protein
MSRARWLVAASAGALTVMATGCWAEVGGSGGRTGQASADTSLTYGDIQQLAPLWSVATGPDREQTRPVSDGTRIYLESNDGTSTVTAYDEQSGAVAWQQPTANDLGPSSFSVANPVESLAIVNDSEVLALGRGNTVGIRDGTAQFVEGIERRLFGTSDGATTADDELFTVDLGGPGDDFVGSPAVDGSTVAVTLRGVDGREWVGWDSSAGHDPLGGALGEVASAPLTPTNPGTSTNYVPVTAPAINGTQILVGAGHRLVAFDASCSSDDCSPIFTSPDLMPNLPASASLVGYPVVLSSSRIAVSTGDGLFAVVDAQGHERWDGVLPSGGANDPISPPAVSGGHLFVNEFGTGQVWEFSSADCTGAAGPHGVPACGPLAVLGPATTPVVPNPQPQIDGSFVYFVSPGADGNHQNISVFDVNCTPYVEHAFNNFLGCAPVRTFSFDGLVRGFVVADGRLFVSQPGTLTAWGVAPPVPVTTVSIPIEDPPGGGP